MASGFLKIFNMSVTASWLVLCVLLLRVLLQKAPKSFRVILWALVGIRLVLPISLESIYSVIPSTELISIKSLIWGENVKVMQMVTNIFSVIWIIGVVGMMLYALISYLRILRKVQEAVPWKDNIWFCDHVETPFILGIFSPRIYLPSNLEMQDRKNVLAHESAHLKRRDHWWKPLGFVLLSIYWFHPLFWIAYLLFCKDIELACDEKVILDKGTRIKQSYSESIINCSVPRRMIAACPLAFGEVDVEHRIKSVLNYKKSSFWIMLAATISFLVLAVCFLTNPEGEGWQSYHPFKNEVVVGTSTMKEMEILIENTEENRNLIRENIAKAANISESEVEESLPVGGIQQTEVVLWGGKEVYELKTMDGEHEKTYLFYPYGYYIAGPVSSAEHTWRGVIKIAEHTLVQSKDGSETEVVYGENCFHLRTPNITMACGKDSNLVNCLLDGSMKTKYGEYVTTGDRIWINTRNKRSYEEERGSVENISDLLTEEVETINTKFAFGSYDLWTHGIVAAEKGMDSIYIMDAYKDKYERTHEFRMEVTVSRFTNLTEWTAGGILFEYEVYSELLEECDTKNVQCIFLYSDTEIDLN